MWLRLLSTCMVSTLLKSVGFHVHFVVVLTDKTTNGPSSKKSKNEKKKGKNFGNEKENVSWFINFCFAILLLFSFCFVCLLVRLFVFFFAPQRRVIFIHARSLMTFPRTIVKA